MSQVISPLIVWAAVTITVRGTTREHVPGDGDQQRLGHASSRTTTDIYGWVPDESEKAAADSLNEMFVARVQNAASGELSEESA